MTTARLSAPRRPKLVRATGPRSVRASATAPGTRSATDTEQIGPHYPSRPVLVLGCGWELARSPEEPPRSGRTILAVSVTETDRRPPGHARMISREGYRRHAARTIRDPAGAADRRRRSAGAARNRARPASPFRPRLPGGWRRFG